MMIVVVMGVSGCGKSTIGLLVAEADRTNGGLSDVYLSSKPLPAGAVIASYRGQPITTAAPAWFGFIDDMPGANWDHPCRYVLIDESAYADADLSTMRNLAAALFRLEGSRDPATVREVLGALAAWLADQERGGS
jgi:hypothetical protein